MEFPVADEQQWLTQNLGPALAAAGLHPRIYGLDDSDLDDAQAILASPAASMLSGIAWHCYLGMGQISTLHAEHPSEQEILVRVLAGHHPLLDLRDRDRRHPQLGERGDVVEPRARPVRGSGRGTQLRLLRLQRDRNDQRAERDDHVRPELLPAWADQQVCAPVRGGSTASGSCRTSRIQRPMASTPGFDDVAFINPDGSKVLVAYNNSPIRQWFAVSWRGYTLPYALAPPATVTLIWK